MGAGTPSALRERLFAGLALSVLALHFGSYPIAELPIASDVRFYLYFAERIAEGAVPHRDYFDHKTQLAAFLGAGLRLGAEAFGLDPLELTRAGFLTLAALGGALLFALFRSISPARGAAGLAGAFALCSFPLLGLLPATGCVPKLLVMVCATGAALCAGSGRWLAAGALGTLAALDWQIGGLAGVAVLVTAFATAPRRGPALVRVLAGGALVLLPFLAYFAFHGALGEALQQTFVGSLDRSAGTQARDTLTTRLARIHQLIVQDCPARAWLAYGSFAGLGVAAWSLARERARRAALLPLVLFHGGLVLFSLYDFQWHADLFALLHGAAFFQGLLWSRALESLARRTRARWPVVLFFLGLLWLARPGPLGPALRLESPQISPTCTLADQREVAAALAARLGERRIAFLESSELLTLLGRENPLPTVFWNEASFGHFRRAQETKDETLARLLREAEVDAYVTARPLTLDAQAPRVEKLSARSGQYTVLVQWR